MVSIGVVEKVDWSIGFHEKKTTTSSFFYRYVWYLLVLLKKWIGKSTSIGFHEKKTIQAKPKTFPPCKMGGWQKEPS